MTISRCSSWASPGRQARRSRVLDPYVLFTLIATLSACSSQSPPSVQASASREAQPPAARQPRVSNPAPSAGTPEQQKAASRRAKETRIGLASFIAARLQGRKTASGEPYDGAKLVAAHPSYPMGTLVRVTNQDNGRVVQVKVIDRSAGRDRLIIDVSRTAAERLDFVRQGTAKVTTEVIEWGTAQPEK